MSVTAVDPNASETGPDSGTFRFTRVGDTGVALTVTFTRSGTAQNADFLTIGTTVIIPAGQASVDRLVTPVLDPQADGGETVIVTLSDANHYDLGSPAAATVVIAD